MKHRIPQLLIILALVLAGASCTTTYDAYGRPVQSVDPGAAAAGAAAAGILGYAIGRDDDDARYYRRGHRGHRRYRGHPHRYRW